MDLYKMNSDLLEMNNANIFLKQYYLIKSEMTVLRRDWKWTILVVMIAPLCTMFFMYMIFGKNNLDQIEYIITGNIVMSIVTGTMLTLGQELGLLKQIRGFDYYSVLSIKKINIIIAFITRATLNTIPSIIVILSLGKLIFDINLTLNWSIVPIVLLSGYSMSASGAFIGMYSKDASQASMITQIIQPIVVYLFPVFYPVEFLPKILQYISFIVPTRYVASALRKCLNNEVDVLSIIMLLLICIISIIMVEKKFDWRN